MKLPEIMLALVSHISSKWPAGSGQTPKHGLFFLSANNSLINERMIFFTDPWQLCPVPLFNKGRDNCQWKENVLRFLGKMVKTNLLLNQIKLCFLLTFFILQVTIVSASFCKPCFNLSKNNNKQTKNRNPWRLGVPEVKGGVINQGDKFHVNNRRNGISETVSLFIRVSHLRLVNF